MRPSAALACIVLLAGCIPSIPSIENTEQAFTLDPSGIQPVGTDLRIDFGRAQTGVIETVSRLQDASPVDIATNRECGAGVVTAARWSDGLTLNFLAGSFQGWVVDQGGIGTSVGLAVGDAVDAAGLEQTSLGREFERGGVFGMLEGQSDQIALLWSGVTCFFR